MRYHFTLIRMTNYPKPHPHPKMKMISIDEEVDKLEPTGNAFWNVKCGTSVTENSWAVPQIVERRITM